MLPNRLLVIDCGVSACKLCIIIDGEMYFRIKYTACVSGISIYN